MQRAVFIMTFVFAAGSLACTEESKRTVATAPVATTRSGSLAPATLTAGDCEKAEFKNDSRCDWYFDPMREAQPSD